MRKQAKGLWVQASQIPYLTKVIKNCCRTESCYRTRGRQQTGQHSSLDCCCRTEIIRRFLVGSRRMARRKLSVESCGEVRITAAGRTCKMPRRRLTGEHRRNVRRLLVNGNYKMARRKLSGGDCKMAQGLPLDGDGRRSGFRLSGRLRQGSGTAEGETVRWPGDS